MSEKEQMTQESGDTTGGTALKALAGAAAGGAATYAVRKALATHNGHDDRNADEHEGDEGSAKGETSDEQAENEPDDSEYAEEEDEDEPEGSADDDLDDGDESDEDYEDQDAPESSADEDDQDDDYEDDDSTESNGADVPSGKGSLRQLVNPSRLASLSHLLVPLAAEAADSAGRYVAEHTSDTAQQQVVNRFIDAFERAS